jgi:predicted membrane-bound mannosyltransferase
MTRSFTLVLLLTAGAALGLRWADLNRRPMHNDEAVNALSSANFGITGATLRPNSITGALFATLPLSV